MLVLSDLAHHANVEIIESIFISISSVIGIIAYNK